MYKSIPTEPTRVGPNCGVVVNDENCSTGPKHDGRYSHSNFAYSDATPDGQSVACYQLTDTESTIEKHIAFWKHLKQLDLLGKRVCMKNQDNGNFTYYQGERR